MDLVKVRNKFIWTWILAGFCVSLIVTGCGPDAQNYIYDPYIVSPERVHYGRDVNLTCYILFQVKFFTFISFTWKRNDERLIHGEKYELSSGSGSFVNSIYKYHTNTLTVKDTRMTDEGKRYMCQVEVAVGTWSSSFNTDKYIFGQEVSSTTTTTASEGDDVTIFLTWRVTDDVMGFWSPSGEVIATIQSISVYIWPNSRSRVKVIRLITSLSRKTVELVICNATKEDGGRYYLTDFKRRGSYGGQNVVIADRKSTTVSSSIVPSTDGQTKLQTAGPAFTSASTQVVDVTPNTVTSLRTTAATTTGVPLSTATTVNTDQDATTVVLYIIVGCCALFIVLTVFIVAAIVLIKIKRQDYWNLRLRRSYITPMQNMPENIDNRWYAEIDDVDITERGAGNIVQPVGNILPACGARNGRERQQLERSCKKIDEDDEYQEVRPLDAINSKELAEKQDKRAQIQQPDQNIGEDIMGEPVGNIPPALGARNGRERQQLERSCKKIDEDDEYQEVRPLDAINSEELAEKQEKRAQMQQPDKKNKDDMTDEMNRTLPDACSHSNPMVAVSAVHGRESGNMTAGIINLSAETSFMTQPFDETWNVPVRTVDIGALSATVEIVPEVGMMTANNVGAHDLSTEGRGDNAESEPRGATDKRYDSLMPPSSSGTYTALETLADITHD